jgi:hypothetical protein
VPFRVRNSQLCFADAAETIKNNCSAGAVAAQQLVYLSELMLPCHKMFDIRDRIKTEQDQKVIMFNPYLSQ